MDASYQTTDGAAERCPACGSEVVVELLDSAGDMPCPHCRRLVVVPTEMLQRGGHPDVPAGADVGQRGHGAGP